MAIRLQCLLEQNHVTRMPPWHSRRIMLSWTLQYSLARSPATPFDQDTLANLKLPVCTMLSATVLPAG